MNESATCLVAWHRRGGDLACEGCEHQIVRLIDGNRRLCCARFGNETPDPSIDKTASSS